MKTKSIIYFLVAFVLVLSAHAQRFDQTFVDEAHVGKETGFAFSMAEFGSSLGGFMVWPISKTTHLGATIDAYFLRDTGQLEFRDPYTGIPYQIGKENNVYIFSLALTAKKRFFGKELDESMRPFLTAGIGPVYGMNFPEQDEDPFGNKTGDTFAWTLGGLAGVGVDITAGPALFVSARIQYRVIPFAEKVGERKNQSMIELRIEIGKRY